MHIVAELMTTNLLTISVDHTMKNVHDLISKKGIRHIPIMDSGGKKMIALVTHKIMIARVIALLTEFGADRLIEKEIQTPVLDIASKDFASIRPQMSLKEAAQYFLNNKNGCLPVLDDNDELVGMLSSSDFVKLSVHLLDEISAN